MTQSPPDNIPLLNIENLLRGKCGHKPNLALKIVRLLVALEYGSVLVYYLWRQILIFPDAPFMSISLTVVAVAACFYYWLCAFGVAIMENQLRSIRDRIAVEVWALIAIGLAPVIAVCYTLMTAYVLDIVDPNAISYHPIILPVPFVGFYSPFILPIFWLKYHHREDEF